MSSNQKSSMDSSRCPLLSSVPSECLSSPEDESTAFTQHDKQQQHQINGNRKVITTGTTLPLPTAQSLPIDLAQQPSRPRHQRKPIRQKPTQIPNDNSQSTLLTVSIKDEPCDADGNQMSHDDSNDNSSTNIGKTALSLLTTDSPTGHDISRESKISASTSSRYKWLQQAFHSLIPPQSQINGIDLNLQSNTLSGKSRTINHVRIVIDSHLLYVLSFSCSSRW
jgi:hypothetical protein